MNDWVIGIDLGATKIALGLIDPHDRIVVHERLLTESSAGPEVVVERIAQVVQSIKQRAPHLVAIGVCSPGPVNHVTGTIIDPPNLPTWRNVPFRHMLSNRLGLPVSLEHDAKAAALGEFHFGAGRETEGARDMVFIIVGTGIGAAIILDGQLYRGRNNSAGEIGHITIDRDGPPGSSGVPGCVEVFAGGPALAQRYSDLARTDSTRGSQGQRTNDSRAGSLSGEAVAQLAAQRDPIALQVMADAGDALGAAIATTAMMMDVDLFVIGGSVAKAGDLILEPARKAVRQYAFRSVASRVKIVATKLHEDGAILGCGWQARQLL